MNQKKIQEKVYKRKYMTSYELLEKLKKENNFNISIPVDVFKIASLLKIDIIYDYFFEMVDSYVIDKKYGKFTLYINKFEVTESKKLNFIISKAIIKKCNENKTIEEEEINKYALKLLTPLDFFLSEIKIFKKNYINKNKKKPNINEAAENLMLKFNIDFDKAKERIKFIEKNMF